jgi:hypothetical protein
MAGGGKSHSCLLDDTQQVQCTGSDFYGQLGGGGVRNDATSFTTVPGLNGVSAIAVGGAHSCAMLLDTSVLCWGGGKEGKLGNGLTDGKVFGPVAASALNAAGSANILLLAFTDNTYVFL